MQVETETYRVVVRVFTGRGGDSCGPLILFPDIPGKYDPAFCNSYQRVGQHGSADALITRGGVTRPANEAETAEAIRDLVAAGYPRESIRVLKRMPRDAYAIRSAALKTR